MVCAIVPRVLAQVSALGVFAILGAFLLTGCQGQNASKTTIQPPPELAIQESLMPAAHAAENRPAQSQTGIRRIFTAAERMQIRRATIHVPE